ncbi:MAG: hypothetical protein Q8R28_05735 [Dehalococcoidia bacterium]|nr:hypothetical protein [Dehalococcoidia bacterium]
MAISETTKNIAAAKRDQLRAERESLLNRKAALQTDLTYINTALIDLKAQIDALKADIPDPTPVPIAGP